MVVLICYAKFVDLRIYCRFIYDYEKFNANPFVTYISFAQNAKEIIGEPIKIGNLLVAEYDFPEAMNWFDAKKSCSTLGKGWRLPTKSELNILYKNRKKIGGFVSNYYWSSTEISYKLVDPTMTAWGQDFNSGRWDSSFKHDKYLVRAVRDF